MAGIEGGKTKGEILSVEENGNTNYDCQRGEMPEGVLHP